MRVAEVNVYYKYRFSNWHWKGSEYRQDNLLLRILKVGFSVFPEEFPLLFKCLSHLKLFASHRELSLTKSPAQRHNLPIFGLCSLSHGRHAGEEVLALAEDQQD